MTLQEVHFFNPVIYFQFESGYHTYPVTSTTYPILGQMYDGNFLVGEVPPLRSKMVYF